MLVPFHHASLPRFHGLLMCETLVNKGSLSAPTAPGQVPSEASIAIPAAVARPLRMSSSAALTQLVDTAFRQGPRSDVLVLTADDVVDQRGGQMDHLVAAMASDEHREFGAEVSVAERIALRGLVGGGDVGFEHGEGCGIAPLSEPPHRRRLDNGAGYISPGKAGGLNV
jgi:hypothetical protein